MNKVDEHGNIPIFTAVIDENYCLFKKLIELWESEYGNKEYLNKTNKYGNYLIHYIAKYGNEEYVKFLIDRKTDINVNVNNYHNVKPINILIENNNLEVIKLLFKDSNNFKNIYTDIFYYYRTSNYNEMLKYFSTIYNIHNCAFYKILTLSHILNDFKIYLIKYFNNDEYCNNEDQLAIKINDYEITDFSDSLEKIYQVLNQCNNKSKIIFPLSIDIENSNSGHKNFLLFEKNETKWSVYRFDPDGFNFQQIDSSFKNRFNSKDEDEYKNIEYNGLIWNLIIDKLDDNDSVNYNLSGTCTLLTYHVIYLIILNPRKSINDILEYISIKYNSFKKCTIRLNEELFARYMVEIFIKSNGFKSEFNRTKDEFLFKIFDEINDSSLISKVVPKTDTIEDIDIEQQLENINIIEKKLERLLDNNFEIYFDFNSNLTIIRKKKNLYFDLNIILNALVLYKEIKIIDFSLCELKNNIPKTIENLKSLVDLNLSFNQLTGNIPETIGNLKSLKKLNLSYNQLTGNIPETIGNIIMLGKLNLSNNQLTGNIPETIGNINMLGELNLSNNQLTGNIPETIGNIIMLGKLNLSNNQLTGNIPETIGNINMLGELNLSNNQLTGNIPETIGNLSFLKLLYLNDNNLKGEVPDEIYKIFDFIINENNDDVDFGYNIEQKDGFGLTLREDYLKKARKQMDLKIALIGFNYNNNSDPPEILTILPKIIQEDSEVEYIIFPEYSHFFNQDFILKIPDIRKFSLYNRVKILFAVRKEISVKEMNVETVLAEIDDPDAYAFDYTNLKDNQFPSDSMGILFNYDVKQENNKVYFFPKFPETTGEIFRIPETKIGVVICGYIDYLTDEHIKYYDFILNVSAEADDQFALWRIEYSNGKSFEELKERVPGYYKSKWYVPREDSEEITLRKSTLYLRKFAENTPTQFVRSDYNLNSSGLLNIVNGYKYDMKIFDENMEPFESLASVSQPFIGGTRNRGIGILTISK